MRTREEIAGPERDDEIGGFSERPVDPADVSFDAAQGLSEVDRAALAIGGRLDQGGGLVVQLIAEGVETLEGAGVKQVGAGLGRADDERTAGDLRQEGGPGVPAVDAAAAVGLDEVEPIAVVAGSSGVGFGEGCLDGRLADSGPAKDALDLLMCGPPYQDFTGFRVP